MLLPGETVLTDEYPVYAGYPYLCDGEPTVSEVSGTVFDLKRAVRAKEVRRCEFLARARMRTGADELAKLHREWEEMKGGPSR